MKYVITFICLLIAASCTKTETPKQVPAVTNSDDTTLTADKLIGKWEATYGSLALFDSAYTIMSSQLWLKNDGYYIDGFGPVGRNWDSTTDATHITFTNDGQYFHTKPDGQLDGYVLRSLLPKNGKWIFTGSQLGMSMYSDTVDVFFEYGFKNGFLAIALVETDTVPKKAKYYETIIKLEKR